jgi:hypothetical protein
MQYFKKLLQEVVYHQGGPRDHHSEGLALSPTFHQQYQITEDRTVPGIESSLICKPIWYTAN